MMTAPRSRTLGLVTAAALDVEVAVGSRERDLGGHLRSSGTIDAERDATNAGSCS